MVDVFRDSPAAKAGLRAGDRLIAIEGECFADQAAMVARLRSSPAVCQLTIDRRGVVSTVTLQDDGD